MFWQKKKIAKKRIFLDYASTTPMAKEVAEKMHEAEREMWANPSALYREAMVAKEKLKEAKKNIAEILACQEKDIVFTSGGTESNNLALLGVFEAHKAKDFVPHVITTTIEHSSVLEVCKEIERRGGEVTYLPVSEEGMVSVKDVREALKENTILVSIMYVNNEIGTIQPIKEIGRVIKNYKMRKIGFGQTDAVQGGRENARGGVDDYGDESILPSNEEMRRMSKPYPYFHTDACQAVLHQELHVQKLSVDMMTLDGIKMYGPRGFGMLYAKSNINMYPILFGGGQEAGRRSGTENVVGAVGFAEALKIAVAMREKEAGRLGGIREYAIEKISGAFPEATLNSPKEVGYLSPHILNVCFPLNPLSADRASTTGALAGLDAEFAVISLDVAGISASYSSSCRTLAEDSSSYVVEALGKPDCKSSSLRFSFGRSTTKEDIDRLILALQKIIKQN